MEAKQLREIIDGVSRELPIALLENKGIEQFVFIIGKIASYLESEQEKRIDLNKRMAEHDKTVDRFDRLMYGDRNNMEEHPGFVHTLLAMKKQSEKSNKLLWSVLGGVITAVVLQLMKIK